MRDLKSDATELEYLVMNPTGDAAHYQRETLPQFLDELAKEDPGYIQRLQQQITEDQHTSWTLPIIRLTENTSDEEPHLDLKVGNDASRPDLYAHSSYADSSAAAIGKVTEKSLPQMSGGEESDTQNPQSEVLAQTAQDSVGQMLWAHLHPNGFSEDPPGNKGDYGCASSVSEALRRAGIFSPTEDEPGASGVEKQLIEHHNWSKVGTWTGDPRSGQLTGDYPTVNDVQPGDVILGYRGSDDPTFSGDDAHSGVIGLDDYGNTVVYSNSGVDTSGNEVWVPEPLEQWVTENGFNNHIDVVRAPSTGG